MWQEETSPRSATLSGCWSGLEDQLASLVTVHGKVVQHVPGSADEDGGGDDAAVDAKYEEDHQQQCGKAKHRVIHQRLHEGNLRDQRRLSESLIS